ncbi:hypothetical protein [uncultured Cohaesibacter sp.]|nr:hypothetical protein [uncultured Cohaesibacter sp.]
MTAALAIPLDRHVRTLYAKAGKCCPFMERAFSLQVKPGKWLAMASRYSG